MDTVDRIIHLKSWWFLSVFNDILPKSSESLIPVTCKTRCRAHPLHSVSSSVLPALHKAQSSIIQHLRYRYLWQRRTHRSLLERACASLHLSLWKQQEMLLTYHCWDFFWARWWQWSLRLVWSLWMGVQPFRLRSLFITCSAGCWFREVRSLFCLQEIVASSMFRNSNLVPSSLCLWSWWGTHSQTHMHRIKRCNWAQGTYFEARRSNN